MKLVRTLVVCALAGCLPAAMAQKWEFGGGAGIGFYTSNDVSSPAGTASAKIGTNVAGSFWLGNLSNSRWGGELRYDYSRGDLRLNQGSTEAAFGSDAHAIHYDFLHHFSNGESPIRPFVAFGGGIKMYRGTGREVLVQPLQNIALLTKAQDLVPMISVGAGFKVQLSPNTQLRIDIHDYLTPFPKEVIVPITGKANGWFNNIVPMVGLVYTK